MDMLIIFAAKYLIALSPILALWVLYKASPQRRKELIIFGAITVPLAYLLALIARHFWYDPRPFVLGGFTPLIPHTADNGFPSDHMLLASALAAVVGYSDRKLAALTWVIALIIGGARVVAGVHHVTDILGSLALVLAAKWSAYAIIHQLWNKNNRVNS